jgi:hypothetical protein
MCLRSLYEYIEVLSFDMDDRFLGYRYLLVGSCLGCCSSYLVLGTACHVHNLLLIKRFDDIPVYWQAVAAAALSAAHSPGSTANSPPSAGAGGGAAAFGGGASGAAAETALGPVKSSFNVKLYLALLACGSAPSAPGAPTTSPTSASSAQKTVICLLIKLYKGVF